MLEFLVTTNTFKFDKFLIKIVIREINVIRKQNNIFFKVHCYNLFKFIFKN